MAESAGLPTKFLKSLECPVCFLMYDKGRHVPKALRCQHTICAPCIDQLKKGPVVKCPTCREDSIVEDVKPNYSLVSMLDDLCAECKSKGEEVHCGHCSKSLCQSCLEGHLPSIRADVTSGLDLLKGEIDSVSSVARDTSMIKAERVKAGDMLMKIRETCKAYRDMIDRCQAELEKKVCEFKENNIDKHILWSHTLNNELINARKCVDTTGSRMSLTYVSKDTLNDMVEIIEECSRVREALKASKESRPQIIDYHFQEAKDVTQLRCSDIGVIKSSLLSRTGSDVSQHTSRVPDYTTATVKCVAGGERGAGVDQFSGPAGVAVTADGYILVADQGNNRVTVYDQNLKCLSTFGSRGTAAGQFMSPLGVAVGPEGKVYVSDCLNNRIQVLTMAGHNVMHSKILKVTGLVGPHGLAIGDNGNLYICDRGNHRILVVKQDGTYVRTIGSKGTAKGHITGEPLYVALTKDKVIVSQYNPERIAVFDTSGRYLDTYPNNAPPAISDMMPRGMAVDHIGNIIIADANGRLVVLDKDGTFVCTIGSGGRQAGPLKTPYDVAVCDDGNIVVCDYDNHRIQVFKVDYN